MCRQGPLPVEVEGTVSESEFLAAGKMTTQIWNKFREAFVSKQIPATVAHWLFRPSPGPSFSFPLSYHPQAVTSSVLSKLEKTRPGIYLCAEPSGCGKSSTLSIAASRANGLKYIDSTTMHRRGANYTEAFYAGLNISPGQQSMFSKLHTDCLLTYSRCACGISWYVHKYCFWNNTHGESQAWHSLVYHATRHVRDRWGVFSLQRWPERIRPLSAGCTSKCCLLAPE